MPRGVMPVETRKRACAKRVERKRQMARCREMGALVVGPYRVYRGDEMNWSVTRPGHATWYYPTLPSALVSLLNERIGDRASGQLKDVLKAVQAAKAEILAAVQEVSTD